MAAAGLKQMARERTVKVGHFIVEFVTPGIGYLLKNAGCDFVLFDTEHSGFHNETIKAALRYFEAASVPAIVRVPSKEYHHIARALDMGAEGIMVPMVNDAKEARAILECMKYTPEGKRGVALGVAHDHYTGGAVLDKLAAANARSTLFAQIETAARVKNAEAIAAIDGVDCLWVGHFDLSSRSASPVSSIIRSSGTRSAPPTRRVANTTRPTAGSFRTSPPASTSSVRASTSSVIPATFGHSRRRLRRRRRHP